MPPSHRQKKRLKDLCKMIESVRITAKGMEDINLEYLTELDNILNQIHRGDDPKNIGTSEETSMDICLSKSNNTIEDNHSEQNQETAEEFFPPEIDDKDPSPPWAKSLWKKIMMKCHPDRLNFQNLSAVEIEKRSQYLLKAQTSFSKQNWKEILYIGIQVGEFASGLSIQQQMSLLGSLYNDSSQRVEEIQNSLSWKWGTDWDDVDSRVSILIHACSHLGIKTPSRIELIQIIANLDSE